MKSKKKTLDEQIDEDARALRDDIRRIGADLINTLRRARREAPAARRPKVRESATKVHEEPEPAGEHPEQPRRRFRVRAIRRPHASLRTLVLFIALGAVVALFLMRRRTVYVAEVAQSGPRRTRQSLRWPRIVASRHTTVETEEYEPAGRET
jgi:hypothetical protein